MRVSFCTSCQILPGTRTVRVPYLNCLVIFERWGLAQKVQQWACARGCSDSNIPSFHLRSMKYMIKPNKTRVCVFYFSFLLFIPCDLSKPGRVFGPARRWPPRAPSGWSPAAWAAAGSSCRRTCGSWCWGTRSRRSWPLGTRASGRTKGCCLVYVFFRLVRGELPDLFR